MHTRRALAVLATAVCLELVLVALPLRAHAQPSPSQAQQLQVVDPKLSAEKERLLQLVRRFVAALGAGDRRRATECIRFPLVVWDVAEGMPTSPTSFHAYATPQELEQDLDPGGVESLKLGAAEVVYLRGNAAVVVFDVYSPAFPGEMGHLAAMAARNEDGQWLFQALVVSG